MKFLDSYFHNKAVDVGRSLAVCLLTTLVYQTYNLIDDWLAGHGSINMAIPIGVVVACGLWEHKSWARITTLCATWCATIALYVFLVITFFGAPGRYSIGFGTLVIKNLNPWQGVAFALLSLPTAHFLLSALHSSKARAEFKVPNQLPDPTSPSVTPPAGAGDAPSVAAGH